MRKSLITTVAVVGAVALTGLTALPASAATTTATMEVTAGALSITAPAAIALSKVAPGATSTGALTGVQVSDLTADAIGWTSSVNMTAFTSATTKTSIPAAGITYTPTTATTTGTVAVAAAAAAAGTGAVQTATAVTGNNTATWGATIAVAVPSDALAATDYTATLTQSVL